MTPEQFVAKWSASELSERAASQEHFLDLCALLGQPTPGMDATGEDYCFEKHVKVVASASKGSKGEGGFVDVWKRGCFAWEYKQKGKYKTLDEAYRQLYQYRDALDNPPLSVVCDIRTTEIRTHFPGYPTNKQTIRLEEIPGKLEVFRRLFTDPDSFRRTAKTTETVTKELAKEFGDLADRLIDRYPVDDLHLWEHAGSPVAHFLMKVMFCLFAEDVNLLPDQAFTKLINLSLFKPEDFEKEATNLFNLMRTGGRFGFDQIPYFNGGLFDDAPALALLTGDLSVLRRVAGDNQNWAGVEPTIFGTLFERILDPKKRAQIGAHYTSRDDILLVVEPVVMQPLRRRWSETLEKLQAEIEKHDGEPNRKKREVLGAPLRLAVEEFRRHLSVQRILDPACGSGNFLYVCLQQMLDLEDEVIRWAARRDIFVDAIPRVRPTQLHGIEINPYAAELAQVVVWIGYLQWLHTHGIDNPRRPILDKLQTIENRDAILDLSNKKLPVPARWPEADFIIGNPPFLGNKLFRQNGLSDDYVSSLYETFDINRNADLCCYWFEIGRSAMEKHPSTRVGLLATQGIRGTSNRVVLERIKQAGDIFMAWSDHEWVLDGAAVNVSIIGFDHGIQKDHILDGHMVQQINPDLTTAADLTLVKSLLENRKFGFVGACKKGTFELEWSQARDFLAAQGNPNGQPNSDIMVPWLNGVDVVRRYLGDWIVDFGCEEDLTRASGYQTPIEHLRKVVKPERDKVRNPAEKRRWWMLARPAPDFRAAVRGLKRFIVVPQVSKHRVFSWLHWQLRPSHQLTVIARDDDYFFGVLQSSPHVLWSLELGTQLEDRPRYTPTSCFETFSLPWPPGKEPSPQPSPGVPEEGVEAYKRIAEAAKTLNDQRERWLNPPEWIEPLAANIDATDRFEDVPVEARALVRQSAIMAAAAKDARLKKRTLTNLYNERPMWLKLAHEQLDRAVLGAYAAVDREGGWSEDWAEVWVETGAGQSLPENHALLGKRVEVEQKVLGNLLRLNHARASVAAEFASKGTPIEGKKKRPAKSGGQSIDD